MSVEEETEDECLRNYKKTNHYRNFFNTIKSTPKYTAKTQFTHSMNEYEYKLELEKLKIQEKEKQDKIEREKRIRRIKIILSIILGIIGLTMLIFGFRLGEASGDADSSFYTVSLLGLFPIISIVFIWCIGDNKEK